MNFRHPEPDEPPAAARDGPLPADDGDDTPLYRQVASTLRAAILRGQYPPGSRLPTEEDLRRRFNVSRYTIREALRQLRRDGLIAAPPGHRPLVAKPATEPTSALFTGQFSADFFDYTLGTRLVVETMGLVTLDAADAARAGLPCGESRMRLTGYRQRVEDGRITCCHEYLIHPDFASVGRLLGRHVGAIVPLFEDLFGERVVSLTRAMLAVTIDPHHAELLGVAPGSPALQVVTTCDTASGRVAMVNVSYHAANPISHVIRREARR